MKNSSKVRKLGSGHTSPSDSRDGRRADPEPEPEMVDLRRLEARQEESRQALEELQQQLCEIQRTEGQDDSSLRHNLVTAVEVQRREGQAQLLELDESLKSALRASSLSDTSPNDPPALKELYTRLDLVSAEAARCTAYQSSYGSELADMCQVL